MTIHPKDPACPGHVAAHTRWTGEPMWTVGRIGEGEGFPTAITPSGAVYQDRGDGWEKYGHVEAPVPPLPDAYTPAELADWQREARHLARAGLL